jgi:hypothetical protein
MARPLDFGALDFEFFPMAQLREPTTALMDTLRMSEKELLRVLAQLADAVTPRKEADVKSAAVLNYPRALVRLRDQVSGAWTTYLVKPRLIHEHGLAFLHGSYVHKDVRGAILLRDASGRPTQISVNVVACRHLVGRLHEVVATFERQLILDQFQLADGTLLSQPGTWCEAQPAT